MGTVSETMKVMVFFIAVFMSNEVDSHLKDVLVGMQRNMCGNNGFEVRFKGQRPDFGDRMSIFYFEKV